MIRFRDHCTAVCDTCVYTRRFSRHERWKLTKERTAGGKLIPPGHRLGHPVLLFFLRIHESKSDVPIVIRKKRFNRRKRLVSRVNFSRIEGEKYGLEGDTRESVI